MKILNYIHTNLPSVLLYLLLAIVLNLVFGLQVCSEYHRVLGKPLNTVNLTKQDRGHVVTKKNMNQSLVAMGPHLIQCNNRDFVSKIRQRGDYWVLENYIQADHGPIDCYKTVTIATHGTVDFTDNIHQLVLRWRAPVSVAVFAPGKDFIASLRSIVFSRECFGSNLVKEFASFHIFFPFGHMPRSAIPNAEMFKRVNYNKSNCKVQQKILAKQKNVYRKLMNMTYPINVARNIAIEASLTHFVLCSDIELYPSTNLAPMFLDMIAKIHPSILKRPAVFALRIFELNNGAKFPDNKESLVSLYNKKIARVFHVKTCNECHALPKLREWIKSNKNTEISIQGIQKRTGPLKQWEPVYIGTRNDYFFDERLSWEGTSDKMINGFTMCLKDYTFFVLNNAFMAHRPEPPNAGTKSKERLQIIWKTNYLLGKYFTNELKRLHGARQGCRLL